ncbi:MAG: chemotaxis protein CheA [Pseudomonadota bacterium]
MSDLLERFAAEARDLVTGLVTSLLAIEKAPDDTGLIEELFRAMHTLKGTSGIFDLAPLTQLTHHAEDLLDTRRNDGSPLSAEEIDALLEATDLLVDWVDALESAGALPDDAAAMGRERAMVLESLLGGAEGGDAAEDAGAEAAAAPVDTEAALALLDPVKDALLDGFVPEDGAAYIALRYTPLADVFFEGSDPLLTWLRVPGLAAWRVFARADWPEIEAFDPYDCNLVFVGIADADEAELVHHFRYASDQIALSALDLSAVAAPGRAVPAGAAESGGEAAAPAAAAVAAALAAGADWTPPEDTPEPSDEAVALATELIIAQRTLLASGAESEDQPARGGSIARTLRNIAASLPGRIRIDPQRCEAAAGDAEALGRIAGEMLSALASADRDAGAGLPEESTAAAPAAGQTAAAPAAPKAASAEPRSAPSTPAGAPASAAASPAPGPAPSPAEPRKAQPVAVADTPASAEAPAEAGPAASEAGDSGTGAQREKAAPKSYVRIDEARLDLLMNLVGELVVAKNALPYLSRRASEVYNCVELAGEIDAQYAVVDRLAHEMQSELLQLRMLPMSQVLDRFPRLVRDTARKLRKQISLTMTGGDVEVDKSIVESLSDPLIHIVRNSLDHGLETPEERLAFGKAEVGTLCITVRNAADQVVVEISDDGRGIDPERVKRKALERGLISAEEAGTLSDEAAQALIFRAGFSTNDTVTDLSGRGVGMDVVQTSINRVGGRVGLSSELGRGTTIRLSLPLSLAISRIVVVAIGKALYGIPMEIISEMISVPQTEIQRLQGGEAFMLRGQVVPLIRLAPLFDRAAAKDEKKTDETIVVTAVDNDLFGFVVDDLRDRMETIVKPLDGILSGLPGFIGTSLMGDGRVLLVINPEDLFLAHAA